MNTKQFRMFTIIQLVILSLVFLMPGCKNDGEKGYRVTLLQTTDMHARAAGVGPFNSYTPATANNDTVIGGFARLAAKINQIKSQTYGDVILIDSGDYTMGTVYDFLWNTDPASFRFIQSVGYDLITLGNHEFDYGPAKLAVMINNSKAAAGGFNIPIVASNTVFDGASGTADDGLEALQAGGSIVSTYVKTLPNGLKIGFIGLIGESASDDSPNAVPVTFRYDYAGADKAYIQGIVDDLRNVQGVDVIIALSHSGLILETDPISGNDITLAENITGIDIIASGHDHEMTSEILEIANTATPTNITRIVCAGEYTENLAQLDFTFTKSGIADLVLTNHTIDDSITGDASVNNLIASMNLQINSILSPLGLRITDVEATMGSFNLYSPGYSGVGESGLGNLLADSVRYVGTDKGVSQFTVGAFATGVIRDNFLSNQQISFADIFAMVPLGITTATDQTNSYPGYSLLKVYLTGAEIWDMCKFNAKIMQFNLYTQNFMHLSGIQYTSAAGAVSSVRKFAWNDYKCTGATTAVASDTALYPCIIDSYVMSMLLTPSIQSLLGILGISIHPKLSDGSTLVSISNLNTTRLDADSVTAGVQEYYAWSAVLDFFNNSTTGLNGSIPSAPYGILSPKRLNP